MKFVPDTTTSTSSQTLMSALFNPSTEKTASQSNKGFADSLRDQINAASRDTSARPRKQQNLNTERNTEKPAREARGSGLPEAEQNLPSGKRRAALPAADTAAAQARDKQATAADADTTAQHPAPVQQSDSVDGRKNTASNQADYADKRSGAAGGESDYASTQTVDSNVLADQPQPPHEQLLNTAEPASTNTEAEMLSSDALLMFANTIAAEPVNGGQAISWSAMLSEAVTAQAAGLQSTTVADTTPAALASLMGTTPAATTAAAASVNGLTAESMARTLSDLSSASQPGASAAFTLSALDVAGADEAADLHKRLAQQLAVTPSAIAQAGSVSAASTAANGFAADLLDDTAALELGFETGIDAGVDGDAELNLAGKLAELRAGQSLNLQQTSLTSVSAQSPATASVLPTTLWQGMSAELSLAPAGVDMLAPGTTQANGASSAASASGLSAALYSVEQRQQAAAEARSAQLQISRGIDTSLSTTSSLKLPGLEMTFGQAGWVDRLGRQLLLQSAQGSSSAQIRLDPPELGSLTVKIQLVDQSAAVNFVSPHAMVRDALEQQTGRLQEMFSEQGMELLDVSVSDHSAQSDSDSGAGDSDTTDSHSAGSAAVQTPAAVVRQSDSLIDFYA